MGGWTTRRVSQFFEATVRLWIVFVILSFSRVCVWGLGFVFYFIFILYFFLFECESETLILARTDQYAAFVIFVLFTGCCVFICMNGGIRAKKWDLNKAREQNRREVRSNRITR